MRKFIPILAAALIFGAPAMAQTQPGSPAGSEANPQNETRAVGAPPAGAPEVQAPVPEVGPGSGTRNRQPPESTEHGDTPTGNATAAGTAATAPQPAQPTAQSTALPAPRIPFTDRGQVSADEEELRAALRGERIIGRITIPNQSAATLIQPEGRDWRGFHNDVLTWIGGIAVLGMLAVLALFFLVRGRIRTEGGLSGRTIQRFNLFERTGHWMTASSFVVLALSGLNLTFGRFLLLPVIGPEAFTALSIWAKMAHNFLAFPFTLGVLILFLVWVKDNIPGKIDWVWLKQGGGIVGHNHPPAARFNAGQKGIFWITVLGGGLVAASGFVLIFPFTITGIEGQQLAQMVHGVLAMLMIAAMLGHIYIGTIGMENAIDAMTTGEVDLNWAREHHPLWVEAEMAKARETVVGPPGSRPLGAD